MHRLFTAFSVSLILAICAAAPASAQNGSLPGGANALSETFKDWMVRCQEQAAPEAGGDAKTGAKPGDKQRDAAGQRRLCVLWQQSLTQKQQRILTVELTPERTGLKGALVLPFGLKLAEGAALQIDGGGASKPFAFSTCLTGGCIVPLQLGPEAITPLRSGQVLSVLVSNLEGQQIKLPVSLTGFGPAYDRIQKLAN